MVLAYLPEVRVIAKLRQPHGLGPRAAHQQQGGVEALHFIRREEGPLDHLKRHRALAEKALARRHRTTHGRWPEQIAAQALRRLLIGRGMKELGIRITPDGILLAIRRLELIEVL